MDDETADADVDAADVDGADGADGADDVDVLVLRRGTEGLAMADYAAEIRDRLPDATVRLARTPGEERRLARTARVITGVDIDDAVLAAAEELELFACVFAGTDHLDADALRERGVAVTNAGGIHAPGIAEQVLGQILTFARDLHEGWRREDRREWRHYQPGELKGSTVTVVGLGSIGTEVVQRLEGFDVDTVGVRYTPSKGGPTDEVIGHEPEPFHDALARSEYVVVACPLTDETRGLIDREAIATLPPSAVIVNVARGPIVDTDALTAALETSGLRGAALDVTDPEPLPADHPLWAIDSCRITPHVGGHTPEHWPRMADILAHNVDALAGRRDGPLRNVVIE
jgi:phosphoglycerate dehydrogenase-like enzyme